MSEHSPEVIRDILMYNAFDYTRAEIATAVNDVHGTDLSEYAVSEILNKIEDEAAQDGHKTVFERYMARGYATELTDTVL